MALLIIAFLLLMFYLFKRETRRDTLIGNNRLEQVASEKSLKDSRKIWIIVGGIFILVSVFMFLFTDTAVIKHFSSHDSKSVTWTGVFAYMLLWGGGLVLLVGLKSFTKHDLNILKYQSMSDSNYEILRQKAYEEKLKEEEQAREYQKAQRNMKIGRAIGSFIANL